MPSGRRALLSNFCALQRVLAMSLLLCLLATVLRAPFALCFLVNDISSSTPSFYAFGASMIDNGENKIAMPFRALSENVPYGSDFFSKSTGRWSNGRNLLDFMMEGIGYSYLDPYLKSINGNFTNGVNFASSGSTARNSTAEGDDSAGLFCLLVQVDQFREYQASMILNAKGLHEQMRVKKKFADSIYFFETGSNDYSFNAFRTDDYNPTLEVNTTLTYMKRALEVLYGLGARTFVVMNVTPLGCAPSVLNSDVGNGTYDAYGCKADWQELVELHNQRLTSLLEHLRNEHADAEWVLFDAHSIFLDAYHNPSKYGVVYPFKACCGAGGRYNVNSSVLCGGSPMYVDGKYVQWTKCEDPTQYIIWDTLHPMEWFAYYIAEGFLNGTHLSPSFNILERVNAVKLSRTDYDFITSAG
ncbi:hypothetical protein KP509_12G048400 [Ceratopteris richardii]|uniref:GDSL esterase/lipase n=1 Tax=Ceratopteris richardii TaxID=49495 RepID=A0A8T2TIV3_CERRI|nr:hypothetical protein KP509_12G048400 [Ceratopteris richardii]